MSTGPRTMEKRKRAAAEGVGPRAAKSRKADFSSTPKAARKEPPASKSQDAAVQNGESKAPATSTARGEHAESTTFQIITGSYERVLHGFVATIPRTLVTGPEPAPAAEDRPKVNFSDTFLFNAHASAIRCLALSPPSDEASKVILATGSTDERINIYSLSTAPPTQSKSKPQLPTLHGNAITENTKNKEQGSLLHHSSSVTSLYFPTRSKLLSSAEDSTIIITRTRDWTPLSTIKAPIPKPQGRPSGDTAAPGEVPAGVNDFAVHPSMKLMVSVGKGEKCMRLWNLVTGKKAGVLNFSREMLGAVGESRFGSGEGRKVVWDKAGEAFSVAFERGIIVFGIDCKPTAKIVPTPRTKVLEMQYLQSDAQPATLLVSTEDGRIMLYDTSSITESTPATDSAKENEDDIPSCTLLAQIGGPAAGITGRVKDFEILQMPGADSSAFLIFAGSSDGTVRLWTFDTEELQGSAEAEKGKGFTAKQVGRLLGNYSTGTRITCLKAFAMTGKPEAAVDEEEEVPAEESADSSSDEESG